MIFRFRIFTLIVSCLAGSLVCQSLHAYTPVFNNTHVLSNGNLNVEVMDPLAPDRQDRFVRFSPMAWIIQANYRETDYFYAPTNPTAPPWNNDPNRYPAGSPMEFDLGDFNVRPPGFDQARVGGEFVKIGVGILERIDNQNYNQGKAYTLAQEATTSVSWEQDRATFSQTLPRPSTTGYRYELETTMQLFGNQVLLEYELTNNGTRSFQTTQYLHNFTSMNGSSPNANSEVEVPWSFTAQGNLSDVLEQQGNKLVYENGINRSRKPVIPVDNLGNAPYEFTVRQTDLNEQYIASAKLPADNPGATAEPLGISIWNDSAGIQFSPEQFVLLSLEPGKSISWSRTYTFGVIPEPSTLALSWGCATLILTIRRRPLSVASTSRNCQRKA